MRHIALILGFLLVLTSLDLGPRLSNGAVASELRPVGALIAAAEQLGRASPQAEPDTASGENDLFLHASAVAFLPRPNSTAHRDIGDAQPVRSCAHGEHPCRAPPFLT